MRTESSGARASGATPSTTANTVEARPPVELPYRRFLAEALAVLAMLVAVGTLPTVNLGGGEAVPAMLAGCGLALVASLAGTVPIVLARDRGTPITAYLGALALRLTAAMILAAAAALSGLFAPAPLLLWLLLAHVGLLVADTRFALSLSRAPLEPALE